MIWLILSDKSSHKLLISYTPIDSTLILVQPTNTKCIYSGQLTYQHVWDVGKHQSTQGKPCSLKGRQCNPHTQCNGDHDQTLVIAA